MEEMDPEPEQDAESLPKTEKGSQKETVEEPSFHPVQLSTKSEEISPTFPPAIPS